MAAEGEYERYRKSSALYGYDVSKSNFLWAVLIFILEHTQLLEQSIISSWQSIQCDKQDLNLPCGFSHLALFPLFSSSGNSRMANDTRSPTSSHTDPPGFPLSLFS